MSARKKPDRRTAAPKGPDQLPGLRHHRLLRATSARQLAGGEVFTDRAGPVPADRGHRRCAWDGCARSAGPSAPGLRALYLALGYVAAEVGGPAAVLHVEGGAFGSDGRQPVEVVAGRRAAGSPLQ